MCVSYQDVPVALCSLANADTFFNKFQSSAMLRRSTIQRSWIKYLRAKHILKQP